MNHFSRRRSLLLSALALPFAGVSTALPAKESFGDQYKAFPERLAAMEAVTGGRIGVYAFAWYAQPLSNLPLQYRADERFAFCSTFKAILVAGVLKLSTQDKGLLQQRVRYAKEELVSYSPITEKHIADGMTIAELCAATMQYSDNTAANLLIKLLGGPAGVTAFARSIGDEDFRLDRWETELNTAIPGDKRDTTTPAAMARSLAHLTLGDALPTAQRAQFQEWLKGNTTGGTRIRASVSADWIVGDKTGTGDYGTTNDIAVLWPDTNKADKANRAPIVMAIYFTQTNKDAPARNEIIASVAKLIMGVLG